MTYYPQEPPPGQPYYVQMQRPSNGSATAGMVLGIISAATCWVGCHFCFAVVPIACGIIGLALSISGLRRSRQIEGIGSGAAKAGMICSIIGLVVAILFLLLATVFVVSAFKGFWNIFQQAQQMYRNMPTPTRPVRPPTSLPFHR